MKRHAKPLIRSVYRSLLRNSDNGNKPEVFGEYGTIALLKHQANNNNNIIDDDFTKYATGAKSNLFIPSTPRQVRNALHHEFKQEQHTSVDSTRNATKSKMKIDTDIFRVIRRVNELSSILHPTENDLPKAGIPVFDFSSTSAVVGEELEFNFFEPRYLEMVREATVTNKKEGDGWFIMRARQVLDTDDDGLLPSISMLMKIVEHTPRFGGKEVFVRCITGPRVRLLQQESVPVAFTMNTTITSTTTNQNISPVPPPPPMIRATSVVFDQDEEEDPNNTILNIELKALREKCLSLLLSITSLDIVLLRGIPPLNPERFSFWVLQFVLGNGDASNRQDWLSSHSTRKRLANVVSMLENIQQSSTERASKTTSTTKGEQKILKKTATITPPKNHGFDK